MSLVLCFVLVFYGIEFLNIVIYIIVWDGNGLFSLGIFFEVSI